MADYTTIDDPSAHFQMANWTGQASELVITNDGNSDLQPDFCWIKCRNASQVFALVDTTRGSSKYLTCASTAAEVTDTGRLTSFNTDGFTLGGGSGPVNTEGGTYVGWQWKINGGTTASNTDGDLTSTVQVNQTSGISIFTYKGKDQIEPLDLGHGLGAVPEVFWIKRRNGGSRNWGFYHKDMAASPQNGYMRLNEVNGYAAASTWWRNEAPTSTIIKTGEQADVNQPSDTFVCWAFKSVQGYSKFGKYTGNGNGGGPFVYTGFKPAWILIKRTDTSGTWFILDTRRNAFNLTDLYIPTNNEGGESNYLSACQVDALSNGFKLRTSYADSNASGGTYVYMAFASNPFVTSTSANSIPTTAR